MQAQCFTLHSTAVISQPSIEKLGVEQTPLFNRPGGGNARIYGPDGRLLTKDLPPSEEGMVYADLDMSLITKEKGFLDNCGHAGRPELLWVCASLLRYFSQYLRRYHLTIMPLMYHNGFNANCWV